MLRDVVNVLIMLRVSKEITTNTAVSIEERCLSLARQKNSKKLFSSNINTVEELETKEKPKQTNARGILSILLKIL